LSARNLHSTVTVREPACQHRDGNIAHMKNPSFLSTAETRAAHLTELSHHVRSLGWTDATLREVEHEIPELEMAMAVYRRLSTETERVDGGATDFLTIAEDRVEHLSQVAHHMRSLERVHASVIEVDNEIPEIEVAIAVYRRLMADPGDAAVATPADAAPDYAAARGVPAEDAAPEAPPVPCFSQFALTHLDAAGNENGDGDHPRDTVAQEPNGTPASN
jgi:hypothetical protein